MSAVRFNPPPGWPPPPVGWTPTETWRPDATWPPAPPGWQLWVPAQSQGRHHEQPAIDQRATRRRGSVARMLLACAIVLTPLVLVAFVAGVVTDGIDPSQYPTQAEYEQATQGAFNSIQGVLVCIYLVVYAFLARMVGFRWFDTFFQLIPFYGIFWQFRIAHRLAYLPYIDWMPRPEDIRWQGPPTHAHVPSV